MGDYRRNDNPVIDGLNKAFKVPTAKPKTTWDVPAPSVPDPVEALLNAKLNPQSAPINPQQVPQQDSPPAQAAPSSDMLNQAADQQVQSGAVAGGPNARLRALASGDPSKGIPPSPWAQAQLAKMQGQ